jgi:hypothetical protein
MEDLEGEVWKDIELIPYHQPEWPFHQVSNMGRIRVLPGQIGRGFRKGIKNPKPDPSTGYLCVFMEENGRTRKFYIHQLVLNAFVGPCPLGKDECRHLNGNKSDNRWPENLEWGTYGEQYEDKISHGTAIRGEQHSWSKLTQAQVGEIRSRQGPRGINNKLAEEFGVHFSTISAIRRGHIWRGDK